MNFKEHFNESITNMYALIYTKIEHPEIAELFERTRDFDDEIYNILEKIDFKERSGELL